MIICSSLLRYILHMTWCIKEQMCVFLVCTKKNIPECFMTIFIQKSKCNMSVHLVKLALRLLRFHACVEKTENQMCTFQLWHLFLTWQTCFPAPDNQIHLRRYGCDEVTRVIYGLATWVKAVCMLGSLGEFTKAYVTLPASGDTVAFQADRGRHTEAFCAIQLPWKKGQLLLKCWTSRGPEFSLTFLLKGNTVVVLQS